MTAGRLTNFLIFERTTGRAVQMSIASSKDAALSGFGAGYGAIEVGGHVSDATHYVNVRTGAVAELPPSPGPWAAFDWPTLQWVDPRQDADFARAARQRRNDLLQACDWTQSADSPLGPDAQAQWAAYRLALRNVPEQAGFPRSIDWPASP